MTIPLFGPASSDHHHHFYPQHHNNPRSQTHSEHQHNHSTNHTSTQCVGKTSTSTNAATPSGASSFGAPRRTAEKPKSPTPNSGSAAAYAARETRSLGGMVALGTSPVTTTISEGGRVRRVSFFLFKVACWLCVVRL